LLSLWKPDQSSSLSFQLSHMLTWPSLGVIRFLSQIAFLCMLRHSWHSENTPGDSIHRW
jgi:hypothetical protein